MSETCIACGMVILPGQTCGCYTSGYASSDRDPSVSEFIAQTIQHQKAEIERLHERLAEAELYRDAVFNSIDVYNAINNAAIRARIGVEGVCDVLDAVARVARNSKL